MAKIRQDEDMAMLGNLGKLVRKPHFEKKVSCCGLKTSQVPKTFYQHPHLNLFKDSSKRELIDVGQIDYKGKFI